MKLGLYIILKKTMMISFLVRVQHIQMQMEVLEYYLSKEAQEVIFKRVLTEFLHFPLLSEINLLQHSQL